MFHRIPMQVIHMALKIQVIPDLMFPISPLPNPTFFAFLLGFAESFSISELLAEVMLTCRLMMAQRAA